MTFEIRREIKDKIRIGGHVITIEEQKNFARDHNNFGEWQPIPLKIIIDADLPESLKNETIMHEILEAVTQLYDIDIKHHKLEVLAVVLYQIFSDKSEEK